MPAWENAGGLQPGAKRRALGDIGNLAGPNNAGQAQAKAGVLTRRAAGALASKEDAPLAAAKPPRPKHQRKAPAAQGPVPAAAAAAANQPRRAGLRERKAVPAAAAPARRVVKAAKAAAAARPLPPPPSSLPDVDYCDRHNPLAVNEWVNEIFAYYKCVEPLLRASPDYMSRQDHINERMRAILVDWLVDVHLKFKLLPETLYLAVNLLDRFLEKKQVSRKHLQLVGVAAMHIASKVEEVWAPQVADWVYICDKAYTKADILGMEKVMLNTLQFRLTLPTAYHFLGRYLKAAGSQGDRQVACYSSYLTELALVDYTMLKYPASMLAAAALYTASVALNRWPTWSVAVGQHSGYRIEELAECAAALATLHRDAGLSSLTAVYKKYSSVVTLKVSQLPSPLTLLTTPAGAERCC